MAMVYLADDLRLSRQVAVKVMHAHLSEDDNFTRRFEREAQCAAGLSHPNLVAVLDQGHDLGRTYLVMEYVPSITLRDLLKKQHNLTTTQAIEISEAVLAGLAAAHHAGIIHRDLKPENVLLADDGRIKLGDFGLARAVSANTTTGQALLGTIAYLSPELVTRGVADARSDLYAFGIMLFEMLTGKQPFTGEQPMQIAYQHAHSEVPLPSTLSDQATPELDELVRWTTQRDPQLRPRDAAGALAYLHDVQERGFAAATQVLHSENPLPAPAETTVLAAGEQTTVLTDATTALPASPASQEPVTPAVRVERGAKARRRKGRILAVLSLLLIAGAATCGWWFGQGPGSLVAVPDVEGLSPEEAKALISDQSLVYQQSECPSLDYPAGQAVQSEPHAGARVERGSAVAVCISTGPRQLPVPQLVGLSEKEAKKAIRDAEFKFGKVIEKRFDDTVPAGDVLAALDSAGNELGNEYTEQAKINLIISAGSLPDVSGLSAADAAEQLQRAGLVYDEAQNTTAHSEEIEKDKVLGIVTTTDPVKVGDTVGLQISEGPELFAIPDVAGLGLQEAMDRLSAAGFSPTTLVPDALRGFAKATGTTPGAGEKVKRGTEVRVKATLAL